MAERHAALNSRALATLLNKEDRISRIQDGFGDFCFSPNKSYKCIDCFDPFNRATHANTTTETADDELSCLSLSEAETSVSTLQISFLKLPKDIRDIIYEYWVAPFRNPWQNDLIKIDMSAVHARRCHPFRNGYDIGVPLSIKQTEQFQPHIPHRHLSRLDYNRLLALSQVSHQVRAEVGAVFWNNVYVDIDHWEYLFVDFLNDRPAVWAGIKKMRMEWACDERATDLNDGWGSIVEFCEFVRDKLVLDEMVFVLSTTPRVTREILALGGDLAWVRAFREINIKKLTVRLFICPDRDRDIDEEDDDGNSDDEGDDEDVSDDSDGEGTSEHDEDGDSGNIDESGSEDDDNDDDSDSSSSSSEDSDLLSVSTDEQNEVLANELGPLMERVLNPEVPRIEEVTEEDEYLASRRAEEAEDEDTESSDS